ncbi:MAG: adenine phosphoribosyltransferase [Cenarchaeum symbiont of Oopsacas minuta]|nr:adenine phosphoribosyltransferase [Cenarchaeum symbiont of Oopsacas minuta]
MVMKLEDRIDTIPNFPKQGIMFRHFGPILEDPHAMALMVEEFAKQLHPSEVDAFVGIESRGFIIATALALHYKKPLIMIRKAGKLPGETLKISYDIEYGSDTMEIEKGKIKQDQRIVICDDLLATGGTAAAAATLVKEAGGKVSAMAFVIELGDLNGCKLLSSYKRISLVIY